MSTTVLVQLISAHESESNGETTTTTTTTKRHKQQSDTFDVSVECTTAQLEVLVNSLLQNEEVTPYAFYVNDVEVKESVGETLKQLNLGTEKVVKVTYVPLSLFRVKPVTRCSDSLPGHTEAILHVQFSPDGGSLASGGGDTTVRFWDVSTTTPRFVCRGHKNHVLATSWSPDGGKFASGDKNGEIRLWNPQTGEELLSKPLTGHTKWITSLSWEPLHRRRALDGGDDATIEERFASSSNDHTCRIWNARTGRCENTLTSHTDSVEVVVWGGEGLLYTASRDRSIICWFEDAGTFKIARILKGHAHRINHLALSNGYVCRTGPFEPCAREAPNASPSSQTTRRGAVMESLKRYNAAKESAGDTASMPFERLVSCSDDFTLYIWHPTLDKKPVLRMTGHVQPITHVNFSPDGRFVASASFDKKIKLWDGRTGQFIGTMDGHVGHVYQVCWSPDSRYIASASKDSTVKVWAVRDQARKAKYTLAGHLDEVYALDWSPNGELLASGSRDRMLKIWRN